MYMKVKSTRAVADSFSCNRSVIKRIVKERTGVNNLY